MSNSAYLQARRWGSQVAPTCGMSATVACARSAYQAYRIWSGFLATQQSKKELVDFVQELRTLTAGMAANHFPEATAVIMFTEGLRTSAARTEVYRVHPNAFEEAVNMVLNTKLNFRSAIPDWNTGSAGSSSCPEPMNLSYAEGKKAELLAGEQCTRIRRCYTCGSTRHLRPSCSLRNQCKAPSSRSASSHPPVGRGETAYPRRHVAPYWRKLSSVGPPGGRGQQDPAPK
ncbi:hypothetical protein PC128_g9921 [Phytophthora cactorum]|nr:hypothetical protein PC120_g9096 [Phytophthora cactorum]KAG3193809.1 hypothetical protein PC128_g9921 [Phytophthora cactorum]KAG4056410.1 hypothetical protein PC123_g8539 [Phytophthora cactorum]